MSAPTWEQIIDAVTANDARIGPYIAQQIRIAKFGPTMPLESIGVETHINIASNQASVESDIEAAILELPEWCEHCGADDWNDSHVCNSCGRSPFDVDERDVYDDDFEDENTVPTPIAADGGDGPMLSTVENDTDESQEVASVSSEIEALSVIASTESADGAIVSDSTSPKANGGVGDTVYFDRPSRPPGLSKLQTEVWDWIERNADGRAATNLSATIVHNGTGRARGVCGKLLTQYRGWTDSMERTA
jgi:hypothetical protein